MMLKRQSILFSKIIFGACLSVLIVACDFSTSSESPLPDPDPEPDPTPNVIEEANDLELVVSTGCNTLGVESRALVLLDTTGNTDQFNQQRQFAREPDQILSWNPHDVRENRAIEKLDLAEFSSQLFDLGFQSDSAQAEEVFLQILDGEDYIEYRNNYFVYWRSGCQYHQKKLLKQYELELDSSIAFEIPLMEVGFTHLTYTYNEPLNQDPDTTYVDLSFESFERPNLFDPEYKLVHVGSQGGQVSDDTYYVRTRTEKFINDDNLEEKYVDRDVFNSQFVWMGSYRDHKVPHPRRERNLNLYYPEDHVLKTEFKLIIRRLDNTAYEIVK